MTVAPRIVAIGTANPATQYTQEEVLELFGVTDPKVRKLFNNAHIQKRHLCLPQPGPKGVMPTETAEDLLQKHRVEAMRLGCRAVIDALDAANLTRDRVGAIACVTTTGFLCPGLSAHMIKELGLPRDVHRVDVVGMGCNGGLNGLQPMVNFCARERDRIALLVCVEICSAAYVFDDTMRTSVVNSLFGDGAAAAVISSDPAHGSGLQVIDFQSEIIVEAIEAMRFDFDDGKNSFFLAKDIPYVIGSHVERPIRALLERNDKRLRDVDHWVIHSGGRKVIDAIKYSLDLSAHQVRHTESVLRDYGNLSSGSFLFSLERLYQERLPRTGDLAVMMTMGPGSTIETSLAVG